MTKKRKRKYKPLTRKAKFRLALVIAAGLVILALIIGILVMAVRGIGALIDRFGEEEQQPSQPAVSQNIDVEPLACVMERRSVAYFVISDIGTSATTS